MQVAQAQLARTASAVLCFVYHLMQQSNVLSTNSRASSRSVPSQVPVPQPDPASKAEPTVRLPTIPTAPLVAPPPRSRMRRDPDLIAPQRRRRQNHVLSLWDTADHSGEAGGCVPPIDVDKGGALPNGFLSSPARHPWKHATVAWFVMFVFVTMVIGVSAMVGNPRAINGLQLIR